MKSERNYKCIVGALEEDQVEAIVSAGLRHMYFSPFSSEEIEKAKSLERENQASKVSFFNNPIISKSKSKDIILNFINSIISSTSKSPNYLLKVSYKEQKKKKK
jgi:hypothetical protein